MAKTLHPVGELRPSQMLHTYGVGAIVDLPNISAIVLGLEDWSQPLPPEVGEPRLLAAVQHVLGEQVEALRAMPVQAEDQVPAFGSGPPLSQGVPVRTFPRWMVCPQCRLLAPVDSHLFDLRANPYRPEQTRYFHTNCPRGHTPVLPVRFLSACPRGHLDDFPWDFFVHRGPTLCKSRLRLYEFGSLSDTSNVTVKCETCGTTRQMSEAFGEKGKGAMPLCRGRHPHLRDFDDGCTEQLHTILLGASNNWFGMTLTALTIPQAADKLGKLIDAHWVVLGKAESEQNIELLHAIGQLHDFHAYSAAEIWGRVQLRQAGTQEDEPPRNLKTAEWSAITGSMPPQTVDFRVRPIATPWKYRRQIVRVALVERLREVQALIGFTRLSAADDASDFDEIVSLRRVPLTRRPARWVPTVEVHGEGIFLQFDEEAIAKWLDRSLDIRRRELEFAQAHTRWREARGIPEPGIGFPGARYVLLHSFSHALMRQMSLECGYNTASLRERIYAAPATAEDGPMAGVLIYTAAADSEGTLGGLVRLGEPESLERIIGAALENVRICASDPHCAEHTVGEGGSLHGASCHACLFVPETSCERANRYLDRAMLVPTIQDEGLAFFAPPDQT